MKCLIQNPNRGDWEQAIDGKIQRRASGLILWAAATSAKHLVAVEEGCRGV